MYVYVYVNGCGVIVAEVGQAQRMKLVFSTLQGSLIASLAESVVLLQKLQLNVVDFLQILEHSPMNCHLLNGKALGTP